MYDALEDLAVLKSLYRYVFPSYKLRQPLDNMSVFLGRQKREMVIATVLGAVGNSFSDLKNMFSFVLSLYVCKFIPNRFRR